MSLAVGSTLPAKVEYGMDGGSLLPPEHGRVVYVHPARRFIVVEFSFPCGTFRESYALRAQIGDSPVWGEEPAISSCFGTAKYVPNLTKTRKRRRHG